MDILGANSGALLFGGGVGTSGWIGAFGHKVLVPLKALVLLTY